jgi:hypothetical protein
VANQFGKKKAKAKEEAQAMGLTEAIIDLDIISDDESEDELEGGAAGGGQDTETQHHVADFVEEEAIEVFKEKTLEDIIEEQRAKLAAQGKVGTPVTAETFAIWRAGILAKRQAAAEARMKELSKKKGGAKALCQFPRPLLCPVLFCSHCHSPFCLLPPSLPAAALSGKELFNYNSSLFVDDDGAVDEEEDTHYQNEQRLQAEREEAMARAVAQKAQEEQQRLFEIERYPPPLPCLPFSLVTDLFDDQSGERAPRIR